jgi:DNA-binding winged helix-turn-helix (wHTH) protein/TolB-like protein
MGTPRRHFFCFGSFRVSETEGVLRRDGQAVTLGPKAVETLLVLIRNRQRVVSREEIMKAVWPDSVVEENNLDQQIAALRRALGQVPNSQIFIETIPRRGYRFLPDVTEEWEKTGWANRARLWLLIAAGVLLLVGAGWIIGSRTGNGRAVPSALKLRQSVAILGFKNLAGGPESAWLSTALTEMLRAELSMGKKLRTISGEEVARTKLDLSLPDTDSLSPETLAAIRKNLDADVALLGSYTVIGQGAGAQVRVDIMVQNTASGEVTVSITRTGTQATLLDMISNIGATLRKELGEGELTASEAQALKNTYPSNLEAERLYAEGLAKLRLLSAVSARPLLEKAIALEPSYPLPYSALADAWSILGYQVRAREAAKAALDRSSALPRESFLLIEGQFRELANESDRAIQIYRSLWTVFPDNPEYGLRLASAQTAAGKGKEALVTIQELRKLTGADDLRVDLAEAAAAEALGDFAREQSVASQASAKAEARRSRLLAAAALLRESWARNQMGTASRLWRRRRKRKRSTSRLAIVPARLVHGRTSQTSWTTRATAPLQKERLKGRWPHSGRSAMRPPCRRLSTASPMASWTKET